MGIRESYDFEVLVNEAERLVIEELERQYQSDEYESMCKCEDCTLDIAALALNSLTPRYRVSLLGSVYASGIDKTEYINEVKETVVNAIEKIKNNPSHD